MPIDPLLFWVLALMLFGGVLPILWLLLRVELTRPHGPSPKARSHLRLISTTRRSQADKKVI